MLTKSRSGLIAGLVCILLILSVVLFAASSEDKVPLLFNVTVPDDRSGYDPGDLPQQPPSFCILEGKLLYEDGQYGPVRVLSPRTLGELWSWSDQQQLVNFVAATQNILFLSTSSMRTGKSDILGLDCQTREVIWRTPIRFFSNMRVPLSRVALVIGDRLLLCGWDTLSAFSRSTGAALFDYKYDLERGSLSTNIKPKDSREEYLIWGIDDRLFGLDPQTGSISWEVSLRLNPNSGKGAYDGYRGLGNQIELPTDGLAVFAFSHKSIGSVLVCLDVRKRGVRWEFKGSEINSFQRDGKSIYVSGYLNGSGARIWCLDLETGNIQWKCTLPGYDFTPFAVSKNVVYCCGMFSRGTISAGYVYAVSKQTGELLWSDQLSAPTNNAPALFDGRLYVLSPKSMEPNEHTGVIHVYSDSGVQK